MQLTGEYRIPAPRERVWEMLNDPDVLRASIPGCQSLEAEGSDKFKAKVTAKVGPVKATFQFMPLHASPTTGASQKPIGERSRSPAQMPKPAVASSGPRSTTTEWIELPPAMTVEDAKALLKPGSDAGASYAPASQSVACGRSEPR